MVAVSVLAIAIGGTAPAVAQKKQLSDKSVKTLMRYAWSLVPTKFRTPKGKIIVTDKTKPELAKVPIDVAREVIRVGRLSGYAQNCDLPAAQLANFRTMMRLERAKNKWSDQQLLFINQLHLLTVMWLTGQAKVVSEGEGKDPKIKNRDAAATKKPSCDAKLKKQVEEEIYKYVKAHPAPKKRSGAASTKPTVQPAKASAPAK